MLTVFRGNVALLSPTRNARPPPTYLALRSVAGTSRQTADSAPSAAGAPALTGFPIDLLRGPASRHAGPRPPPCSTISPGERPASLRVLIRGCASAPVPCHTSRHYREAGSGVHV